MLATAKKYAILRAHLPNMTESEATPDNPAQPSAAQVDLSQLRMMPAWVAGMSSLANPAKYEEREEREERRGQRPGGRDRRDGPPPRRDGPPPRRDGGAGGRGEFRPRGERREGQGGGQRDRREGQRHQGEQGHQPRERMELPKDIQVVIEPRDSAVEALAAHIRASGHAFSMFDAARLVLADGERFQARFICAPERAQGLFQTPANGGLYLTREEALSHVLRGAGIEQYYRCEEIELEEPKGDFKAVGVCGISGELLGPPNHHSFQTALLRLHRERFSNLPLEDYKRRVRTETGEEVVAKWKEQQRKGQRWIYIKEQSGDAEPVAFAGRAEMEAHFRRTHGDDACAEVREAVFTGQPDKTRISHALVLLARNAVDAARKHLFEMSQKLAGGFERRHLKLFKRRAGKLFVCRVKPRPVDPGVVFSERVSRIVEILKSTQGIAINDLVEKLAPAKSSDVSIPGAAPENTETAQDEPVSAENAASPAVRHQLTDEQISVLKDIRWLTNEGYVIEYSDGMVFLGVQGEPASAKPKTDKPAPEPKAVPVAEEQPVSAADVLAESAEAVTHDAASVTDDAAAGEPAPEATAPVEEALEEVVTAEVPVEDTGSSSATETVEEETTASSEEAPASVEAKD